METPGAILKEERENQQRSLKDAAHTLRIKTDYLKALEEDKYSELPAEFFTRAYLRFYSEWLGLESSRILDMYSIYQQESRSTEELYTEHAPVQSISQKLLINRVPWKPVLALLVAVSVISLLFVLNKSRKELALSTELIGAERAEASESSVQNMLRLEIRATEITWVSINIDDSAPHEHLLRSGESLTFRGSERFALKIGNAGGTKLFLNNKDIGPLGPHGKVVDIVLP